MCNAHDSDWWKKIENNSIFFAMIAASTFYISPRRYLSHLRISTRSLKIFLPMDSRETHGDSSTVSNIIAKNDLSDMRKPYRDQDDGIVEDNLSSKNPMKFFENWFNMVKESKTVYEPNSFCICTSDK